LHVLKLLKHNDAASQQYDNCTSTANTVHTHTHTQSRHFAYRLRLLPHVSEINTGRFGVTQRRIDFTSLPLPTFRRRLRLPSSGKTPLGLLRLPKTEIASSTVTPAIYLSAEKCRIQSVHRHCCHLTPSSSLLLTTPDMTASRNVRTHVD
jgi:hypothetical protein